MSDSCPYCGGHWIQIGKDTSSGEDIREFKCVACGKSEIERRGKALWQILSDSRERDEAMKELFPGKKDDEVDVAELTKMLEREDKPRILYVVTLLEQAGTDDAIQAMTRFATTQAQLIVSGALEPEPLAKAKTRLYAMGYKIYTPAILGAARKEALSHAEKRDLNIFAELLLQVSLDTVNSFVDNDLRREFVAVFEQLATEYGGEFGEVADRLRP